MAQWDIAVEHQAAVEHLEHADSADLRDQSHTRSSPLGCFLHRIPCCHWLLAIIY